MAITSSVKDRLKNHETVFGTFYKLNSPIATEMLGWAGFDFIVVDCEHSPIGYESKENIIRTAEKVGLSTRERVPCASEEHIFHAQDSGAVGVQIPNLTSAEQYRESVSACKYFPAGTRGLSRGTRNAMFGLWNEAEKPYVQAANDKSLVVVHIENKELAERVEEICQIPEIDVVFVGPADMSQSLGIPGKSKDPRVVEIALHVIETAERYGKVGGIAAGKDNMDMYIQHGARYIMYSSDAALFAGALKNAVSLFNPYRVR